MFQNTVPASATVYPSLGLLCGVLQHVLKVRFLFRYRCYFFKINL